MVSLAEDLREEPRTGMAGREEVVSEEGSKTPDL